MPSSDFCAILLLVLRECWNWQTGKTKDLVGVCSCGFKSHLPHWKVLNYLDFLGFSTFLLYPKIFLAGKIPDAFERSLAAEKGSGKIVDFYRRVGIVCNSIPEGRVASYGQIAPLCGKPRNARQVGYCLNRGRAGEVPAYRVVNGQGRLTGAAAFEHPDMQRMLLESEGVRVSEDMRVDMQRFGWKNTLEEALKLREQFEREGI